MEMLRCPTCLSLLLDGSVKRCPACHSRFRGRTRPIVLGRDGPTREHVFVDCDDQARVEAEVAAAARFQELRRQAESARRIAARASKLFDGDSDGNGHGRGSSLIIDLPDEAIHEATVRAAVGDVVAEPAEPLADVPPLEPKRVRQRRHGARDSRLDDTRADAGLDPAQPNAPEVAAEPEAPVETAVRAAPAAPEAPVETPAPVEPEVVETAVRVAPAEPEVVEPTVVAAAPTPVASAEPVAPRARRRRGLPKIVWRVDTPDPTPDTDDRARDRGPISPPAPAREAVPAEAAPVPVGSSAPAAAAAVREPASTATNGRQRWREVRPNAAEDAEVVPPATRAEAEVVPAPTRAEAEVEPAETPRETVQIVRKRRFDAAPRPAPSTSSWERPNSVWLDRVFNGRR